MELQLYDPALLLDALLVMGQGSAAGKRHAPDSHHFIVFTFMFGAGSQTLIQLFIITTKTGAAAALV